MARIETGFRFNHGKRTIEVDIVEQFNIKSIYGVFEEDVELGQFVLTGFDDSEETLRAEAIKIIESVS